MTSPLAGHAGRWSGSNEFRLMPDDPPAAAPMSAEITVALGGRMVSVAYTWSHPQDGEQEGLLVVGPGDDDGTAIALWSDSWHQAPAARDLRGTLTGTGFTVGYAYTDDGWRWDVDVRADGDDRLVLRMDNVGPPGEDDRYAAMHAELRRTDAVSSAGPA